MKQLKQLMFGLLVVQSIFTATGCSIVGFGIGVIMDSKKTEKIKKFGVPIDPPAHYLLQENHRIQIFLKNGEQQDGLFVKLIKEKVGDEIQNSIVWYDMTTNQQVSTQFTAIERIISIENERDKWADLEEAGTIKANSRIEIVQKDGQKLEGRFLKQMEQQVGNEIATTIECYEKASNRQVSIQVAAIKGIIAIENQRDEWVSLEEVPTIKKNSPIEIVQKDGQLPRGRFLKQTEQQVGHETVTTIEWYDKSAKQPISTQVAAIEGIVVKKKRNQQWIGLGIGFIMDALIIKAIVNDGLDIIDIDGLGGFSFGFNFGF